MYFRSLPCPPAQDPTAAPQCPIVHPLSCPSTGPSTRATLFSAASPLTLRPTWHLPPASPACSTFSCPLSHIFPHPPCALKPPGGSISGSSLLCLRGPGQCRPQGLPATATRGQPRIRNQPRRRWVGRLGRPAAHPGRRLSDPGDTTDPCYPSRGSLYSLTLTDVETGHGKVTGSECRPSPTMAQLHPLSPKLWTEGGQGSWSWGGARDPHRPGRQGPAGARLTLPNSRGSLSPSLPKPCSPHSTHGETEAQRQA